jgi:hypothetical protein
VVEFIKKEAKVEDYIVDVQEEGKEANDNCICEEDLDDIMF